MPRLIITNGPLAGGRYEVGHELVLGGSEDRIGVAGDEATPHRAVVRTVGGDLQIEDLGSDHGTWVNGERIAGPVVLSDGTELRVGSTIFIVEIDAQAIDRNRTQPELATIPLPPLAPSVTPAGTPYAPPALARRRRADTRRWIPAAATFATIIATAVALMMYFALR